jgi:hypothetical protein
MLVEQVLDHESVEDPFDGRRLECDEGVRVATECRANVVQESERLGNVLDHVSTDHGIRPNSPVGRTVKLPDELDPSVGTRIRPLVRRIETHPAAFPPGAKTLQEVAPTTSNLHDRLASNARIEQSVDEMVDVLVESGRPRLIVLIVLAILQEFGAKGSVGNEAASRAAH